MKPPRVDYIAEQLINSVPPAAAGPSHSCLPAVVAQCGECGGPAADRVVQEREALRATLIERDAEIAAICDLAQDEYLRSAALQRENAELRGQARHLKFGIATVTLVFIALCITGFLLLRGPAPIGDAGPTFDLRAR